MLIKENEIMPGDIIIFERAKKDYVGLIFSLILKLFNPKWEMYGWHMAFITERLSGDWVICEATWPCVRQNYLSKMGRAYRVYRWFDKPPEQTAIYKFVSEYMGKYLGFC